MFRFERLDIWQRARSLTNIVYDTVDSFPKHEQFALAQQLRRAIVSVSANIAEGSAKSSDKEFSRYLEIAFGSLCEVIAELYVARDRSYLTQTTFDLLYSQSEELGKMLSKFRGTIENSWKKKQQV